MRGIKKKSFIKETGIMWNRKTRSWGGGGPTPSVIFEGNDKGSGGGQQNNEALSKNVGKRKCCETF